MTKFYLLKCRYLTVLLLLATTFAFAQSRAVSGKVTSSDDGTGLPGVNIIEKGTNNGAVTDSDGNFSLNLGDNATLVFSFVGFTTQEIVVGTQTNLAVSLQADVTALNEVVVVGYGTQDKKEITGSVVSLSAKDFNKGNINDPTQLLQGKVAGLSIYNKGGDPNSSPVIRMRGLSSVGANQSPLVVVDGVLGASLDNIDPNDIETMTVLKDGSAAAIYGSRGSSGVILVTTKKGARTGAVGVTYNAYIAAATVYRRQPIMTASQYVANGGNDLGSETDWQKEVTQTGVSNVHNIALSGGTQNTTFRLSTNIRDVNGVLKKSGFDQINTRANLTHSALNNKLNFDFNMAFTNRNYSTSFPEALRYATLYNPTAPIYFENGDYYQAILFDNFNPVAILNQNINEGRKKNLNYGAKIDYNIVKNLTATVNFGQQYDTDTRGEYYAIASLFRGFNRHGLARRYSSEKNFTLAEGWLTYAKGFGKLDLTASAGYSYQEEQFKDFFVEVGNFPNDELGYNFLGGAGTSVQGVAGGNGTNLTSNTTPLNKIIAFFGRVNLAWDNGIFLNASIRREGSTKLGPDNQWGVFPSFGAGVDVNKFVQIPNVSLLKLRVGYGVTGSLPGQAGLSQEQWGYDITKNGAITQTQIANPDLKWEQKAEANIGLEFGVGKLSGTVDYYRRTISDFLLNFTPDAVTNPGLTQWLNAGELETPGFEVTLNYNGIQAGAFTWSPGINLSHYKTTLNKFIIDRAVRADFGAPGQNGTNVALIQVGEPIGQLWGPVFDGVEGNGEPRFKDLNGDGTIIAQPANALLPTADMKSLGTGIPTLELGWTNQITYKNWDLNVFFRGAFGHSLLNQFRGFYEPIDPGAINSYNRITTDKAVDGLTTAKYSSLYVEKANFVKLDNLTLGYNFPLAGRLVKSFRLYASGQNLFVISNYTGIDPEPVLQDNGSSDNGALMNALGSFNNINGVPQPPDVLAAGIDRRNNYFTMRTFTFGLNIGF